MKAGGPNYCACFVKITDKLGSTTDYTQSYVKAYEQEFAHARDVNNLYGEQNAFRYLPLKNMVLMIFGVSIYHIVPKLNFMSLVSLVMRINIVE